MSVYRPAPVSEEPECTLRHWCIIELPNGERHFAGYNVSSQDGRVSSKIMSFDPATMNGVTRSGRIYHLDGEPGSHGDVDYLLRLWAMRYQDDYIKKHEGVPEDWRDGYPKDHSGPAEAKPN